MRRSVMQQILEFLDYKMKTPIAYESFSESWFHYLFLVLMFLMMFLGVKYARKTTTKELKKTLLLLGLLMIVLEIYKQIIFTYEANDYQWYAFPFQFCSTPMYLFVLYGLSKNERLEGHLLSFLATYGFFAGIAVMLYPSTVFVETIGINIQTMVHHGFMAIVGVSLLLSKVQFSLKTMKQAMTTFGVLVLSAIVLNELFNLLINDGTFNMFFINSRFENGLPVLSLIEPHVPHTLFVLIYFFGFSLVAYLMLLFGQALSRLLSKHTKMDNHLKND